MTDIDERIDALDEPWRDVVILEELYEDMSQVEIAERLGCNQSTISKWLNRHDISTGWKEGTLPYRDIAMFSGGHDSLTSTHYVMENMGGDVVLHIDTGTGIPETREFVEDVCETYGWDLEVISPNITLEEFAIRWGFPKPPSHSWIYRYLKHHPLGMFVTRCKHKPTLHTGVRKHESTRRMENVSAEDDDIGRWIWSSPIAEWTDQDVEEYIDEHDLPRNPVAEAVGMSGECFCGAYSDRFSELDMLEQEYPEHAEWIYGVEEAVQRERDDCEDNALCYWGDTGEMVEQDFEMADEDRDMMLCEDCEIGGHR